MTSRRSSNTAHGLERRGKPIALPIIALALALGGWFADQQKFKGGDVNATGLSSETMTAGAAHPTNAVFHGLTGRGDYYQCVRPAEIRPQHPAYKRLLEFCMKQTQERR